MLRSTLAILAVAASIGCHSSKKKMPPAPVAQLSGVHAVAISQDPPTVAYADRLDLSREGRGESAFVGYRDTVATYEYLRSDDRELHASPFGGVFERRAVSERVSLTYR